MWERIPSFIAFGGILARRLCLRELWRQFGEGVVNIIRTFLKSVYNEKGINVLRSQNIILVELSRKFPLDFKERVSVVVIYSWDQAK